MAEIRCRAQVSEQCFHGKSEASVGTGYVMSDDGTYRADSRTIVCDPCYLAVGGPVNEALTGAIMRAKGVSVLAEPVEASELAVGEMFSTVGPEYWSSMSNGSVGERVYIRTGNWADEVAPVFRITIQREEERQQ